MIMFTSLFVGLFCLLACFLAWRGCQCGTICFPETQTARGSVVCMSIFVFIHYCSFQAGCMFLFALFELTLLSETVMG